MAEPNRDVNPRGNVIGLLPAGGRATRVSPLPCSKEIYPIGFDEIAGVGRRPKAVCYYVLECMRLAGITTAYFVVRPGKWDILDYLGDGQLVDMHLAYLTVHVPYGVPFTLDQAYPFVRSARVALGLPDVIFRPRDAFRQLLARQTATGADVVLGLFPTDSPHKSDVVALDDDGRVRQILVKPDRTALQYAWMIAVWTPTFTEYLHATLPTVDRPVTNRTNDVDPPDDELFLGEVLQAAVDDGMYVAGVTFSNGVCLDIGTPDEMEQALRRNLL